MPFTNFHRAASACLLIFVLFGVAPLSVEAASTKTYWHPSQGFGFSYPSIWTVQKGTKSVSVKPPSARIAALKTQGTSYSLTAASLNNDSRVFTPTLRTALSSGWSPFVKAYAKAMAKKLGGTATTGSYAKTDWTASLVTVKKTAAGVTTWWRFILLTKDKASVYVVSEQWTKQATSPFASEAKALVKRLTRATDYVSWTYDGSVWKAESTPPACANPLVVPSPVDVSQATSILYPGQSRGGNYKPHGGFRFDNNTTNAVAVTAPLDAYVVDGARYVEAGQVQYLFDFYTPCGIRYRLDHLFTLSPAFAAIAEKLPAALVDDSRTTTLAKPVAVNAGDVVATAVGFAAGNTFFDFGVYDLRAQNAISFNSSWAAAHPTYKGTEWHAICWLNNLPEPDQTTVKALPGGDGVSGKSSDYCR